MATDRRIPFLRCNLLLVLIISFLCFSTATSFGTVPNEEKVNLELYYETLCPYCSRFIVNYLYKIFDNGLIDIVNLKLIPYGNAKIKGNGTIQCQHGPDECLLNTIEACAINIWPDVNEHFPFVYCVEKLVYQGEYTQWGTCFEKLGLDREPVDQCYASGLGKKDYQDFISFICKAYKGSPAPPACSELSTVDVIKLNRRISASYTGEKMESMFSSIVSALRSWMDGA